MFLQDEKFADFGFQIEESGWKMLNGKWKFELAKGLEPLLIIPT